MALAGGAKLGPYVIQSPLGAGGMGEVYRARDTRLGRDVAIKVLPSSVAADTDRLNRFQQEARTVATLNHPNIVALFDVGEYDSSPYLVTELLEGETLRDRIRAGPLPARRAIEYALQIAEGLAAAHAKGIVHRDLKPENVMITKDQRVKILDFGLAKLARTEAQLAAGAEGLSAAGMTQTMPGLIVGTAGYMSPEQIRGDELDARTDIFNLGAILYETLSGRRAFGGGTPLELMNSILTEEPPEFDSAAMRVFPGLERIVRRCLEKSREQRFQSAKDLAFALEALSGSSPSGTPQAPVTRRAKSWGAIGAVVGLLLIAAIAAYLAGMRRASPPARFERLTFERGFVKGARFAPDGQTIIYSAAWEGRPYEVFTLRIGDRHSRSLELAGAMLAGVSNISGELAVLTNVRRARMTNWMQFGTLSRAPATGGVAREILEGVWDADISRDGKDFAIVRAPAGPQQLEYPIGKVLFKTNGYISHPRISPDGRRVGFLEHPVWGDDRGYVAIVDAKARRERLTDEAESIQGLTWSRDGHDIWYAATEEGLSQERVVFAVAPGKKPRSVFHVPGDCIVWDIAPNGRLLFSHEELGSAQMAASPSNSPERNVSVLGFGAFGAISADGKTIAFTEAGHGVPSDYLVYFRRFDSSAPVELGEGSVLGITPDSKYVVAEIPSQPTKLRVLPAGAGEAYTIDVAPVQVDRQYISWMPGGKEFVFQGVDRTGLPRGYRVPLQGGVARPLTNGVGAQFWNQVSPDGKSVLQKLAPGTDRDGPAVIVDLLNGQSRAAPLLPGEYPAGWHQNGKEVFVVKETDTEATLFRVDVLSGRREVWKQIRLTDPAGILSVSRFYVTASGNAYTYSAGRALSNLYLYSPE